MTLRQKQAEQIELFNTLGSWNERFQYLIDLGMELPEMPQHLRGRETQILSCTSRTYFMATATDGIIHIQGWSNAAVPAGLIALIRKLFDGCSTRELKTIGIDFHIQTGLIDNLRQQRKAGLLEMVDRLTNVIKISYNFTKS